MSVVYVKCECVQHLALSAITLCSNISLMTRKGMGLKGSKMSMADQGLDQEDPDKGDQDKWLFYRPWCMHSQPVFAEMKFSVCWSELWTDLNVIMQILGYYQQLIKRFTWFVIVQYWSHPYIDIVHNINKNPYAKYQNNYSEYIYDWKKLIYLFS